MTLVYTEDDHAIVYLGGAGIKQQLSTHFGLRADARLHVYKASMITSSTWSPSSWQPSACRLHHHDRRASVQRTWSAEWSAVRKRGCVRRVGSAGADIHNSRLFYRF